MVTELVTKVEESVEELASSQSYLDFDSIRFFVEKLFGTHTLGTTTHTLGPVRLLSFYFHVNGRGCPAHTLGTTTHTPGLGNPSIYFVNVFSGWLGRGTHTLGTTTHTLGTAPSQFFFLEKEVRDGV